MITNLLPAKLVAVALAALCIIAIHSMSYAGNISTYAGGNGFGYSGDGGDATAAKLNTPTGVFVDAADNLFFAEYLNHSVRKVDAGGTITTIAGGNGAGYSGDGGPATAAQLDQPFGIYFDSSGNLYIADQSNHAVRKVDAGGTITTIAGGNGQGYSGDGGPATAAQLYWPSSVFPDGAGNLYIADTGNHAIRKVDAGGTITTIAGGNGSGYSGDGGPATAAQFSYPYGVHKDGAGNCHIADRFNHAVRKVDAGGAITTIAGGNGSGYSGDGGPATAAQLNMPHSVFSDGAGNLYIADTDNLAIRKVDAGGTITTIAGGNGSGYSGDGGPATAAQCNQSFGAYVDASGSLFISDSQNHAIRKVVYPITPIPPDPSDTSSAGGGCFIGAVE